MCQLPTTAIVADEVTSRRVALVCLFEEVIMNFKQKLMACTALLGVWHPARYCWSAIGVGCAEDREARTPDRAVAEAVRAAAEAAQGSSGRARPNAQEDRESGSEGGSRAGALFGPAAHGYQGPATAASAGKGEGDVGRLHRRGDGLAPTQHGQRHWNGLRDNPVSVFTALQRARISRDRPAEPNLAARRGQHRSLPEAFRVLRVGLPGRRQHIELQPEQQLGCAFATRLFHLRQQRLGISHPRRPNVEPPDPEPGRDHAAQGEHPAHHRRELRGRVQLSPPMADPRGGGRLSGHLPRRVGRKSGRDRRASTATAPLGTGGAFASGGIVNGTVVNFVNTGGGGDFLQNVNVTADQAPDIIEKVAFDPGWGHYEIYGLQRFFSDNTLRCVVGPCVAGSTAMVGTADNKTTFGAGVGGSVLLPLIPKYLEFTASGLYGRGV